MESFAKIDSLPPEKRRLLAQYLGNKLARRPIQGEAFISQGQILPLNREVDSFPLSFAQQRLWFLDQFDPDNPSYNLPIAIRLIGILDTFVLERCMQEMVQRHEILRTIFTISEGKPRQVIIPALPMVFPLIDLTFLPTSEREDEMIHCSTKEMHRPFDLASGPLMRAYLLQMNHDEHIFLLSFHHIISDGWSISIFFQEFAALYCAFSNRQPSPLPELPIQYADFAVWQRRWLKEEVFQDQLIYWQQQLAGAPTLLKLPTDYPRPSTLTSRGAGFSFTLSSSLTKSLKSLSHEQGTTLFMTLLAAFQLLLYRYSGQDDIVIGVPITNRPLTEVEGLIGMFVNTLVLRSKSFRHLSFREMLKQVQEVALGAFSNQDVPFEQLVEMLHPERDTSYTPLFQVMFNFQKAAIEILQLSNLTCQPLKLENQTSKFDLSLDVLETNQTLKGRLEYRTDLFKATTIQRMARNWQTLLEVIVTHPDQPVSLLPILTYAERRQILIEWNATETNHTQNLYIHQIFEKQVECTPEALAITFERTRLSYDEVNRRANQLAHHLQALGVKPEIRVGICIERSVEMVISLLAVVKAGGAFVPLDPTYPPKRLSFMLADAQVSILLTQSHLVETLLSHSVLLVLLDKDQPVIAQRKTKNAVSSVAPENIALMIYTSGSTGTPKGAMITHANLLNYYLFFEERYQLRSTITAHLQMASFSFDVFIADVMRALCSGASLVMCTRDVVLAPEELYSLMQQERVDSAEFVPAVLKNLADYLYETKQDLAFMRILAAGADSWHVADYKQVRRLCGPETRLINVYGLTEATIDNAHFEESSIWQSTNEIVPIGRPIANTQLYILDNHLEPVPIGVPGELYVGGRGVGRGYFCRPDLTAERFIPDMFSLVPGARLYRTGDLVGYLPDGTIDFLGRLDDQVKLRGYRIELGDIESTLRGHPNVHEVVVIAKEDIPNRKRLIAYVVLSDTLANIAGELRHYLKERLPAYMIPSSFVVLDTLPLTVNGKIDHQALLSFSELTQSEVMEALSLPRTIPEKALVDIWSDILRLECVDIHDNFFELGGDSILSIQVVSQARQRGLHITTKQLFQHQTIAELASVSTPLLKIQAEQGLVMGAVHLTPIQHWFFEQQFPNPHYFNQAILLETQQTLKPVLLENVFLYLLKQHDALRLRFICDDSNWRQINSYAEEKVSVLWTDLTALSPAEQKSVIEAMASQMQATLNITQGPLLRVAFFHLGEQQPGRLFLVIHHLVIDGVSWRILLEDLQTAYQQLERGEVIQIFPKTTSFQRWAECLKIYARSSILRQEVIYWLAEPRTQLCQLPVDHHLGGINTWNTVRVVSAALTETETYILLQETPAAYHTHIDDLLLTALVQTFARWTGNPQLLLDLEGHGREEIMENLDLSRTIGWFTTIFPVLLDLEGVTEAGEAIELIKKQLRNIPNRGIGYSILRYLSGEGELADHLRALPQPQVCFNYLGQFDQILGEKSLFKVAQEATGSPISQLAKRNYLLEINSSIVAGKLRIGWFYSEQFHDSSTIEKLAYEFINALRILIFHCQQENARSVH